MYLSLGSPRAEIGGRQIWWWTGQFGRWRRPLWEVAKRTGVTARVSECFVDHRNPASVEHSVQGLVSQRIYGITLG